MPKRAILALNYKPVTCGDMSNFTLKCLKSWTPISSQLYYSQPEIYLSALAASSSPESANTEMLSSAVIFHLQRILKLFETKEWAIWLKYTPCRNLRRPPKQKKYPPSLGSFT
jgi:hypothetical protein